MKRGAVKKLYLLTVRKAEKNKIIITDNRNGTVFLLKTTRGLLKKVCDIGDAAEGDVLTATLFWCEA